MSRLDPLIDALTRTGANELRLVAGERIHIIKGGARQDIGRDPVAAPAISALAQELLKPADILALRQAPKSVSVDRGGSTYTVELRAVGSQISATLSAGGGATAGAAVASPADAAPPPRQSSPEIEAAAPSMPPPPVTAARREGKTNSIDALLTDMIRRGASDLHLSTGAHPVLRVHGEMHFLKDQPLLTSERVHQLVDEIITEGSRADFKEKHDADFAYEVPGLARFRVNAFMDRKGVGAVLRQIPIDIIPADVLGLPRAAIDLCYLTKGLVVVTGPTGSGKSTTLASMIDYINKNRADHIITIEDPVEFVHKNLKCLVNQREVGIHTRSFKAALRAALREDPDIVLVGEMRDLETIAIAIETAETGHLVFGTLHTTTAVSTVDRIIDQFPADQQAQIRVMLSESLKGVIAQVLCKKEGGGRVAAMEILLGNTAVASLIREGKTFQLPSVMQTSRGSGMVTMNESLLMHVKNGLVAPKEAWMKSVDKSGLLNMYKNNNLPTEFS